MNKPKHVVKKIVAIASALTLAFSLAALSACGPSYDEPSFKWTKSGDGYTAQAIFTSSDGSDEQVVDATVTSAQTKAPACTSAGVLTYTAKVTFNGVEYVETKDTPIAALGHDYRYTSNGDRTHDAVCQNDASHVLDDALCTFDIDGKCIYCEYQATPDVIVYEYNNDAMMEALADVADWGNPGKDDFTGVNSFITPGKMQKATGGQLIFTSETGLSFDVHGTATAEITLRGTSGNYCDFGLRIQGGGYVQAARYTTTETRDGYTIERVEEGDYENVYQITANHGSMTFVFENLEAGTYWIATQMRPENTAKFYFDGLKVTDTFVHNDGGEFDEVIVTKTPTQTVAGSASVHCSECYGTPEGESLELPALTDSGYTKSTVKAPSREEKGLDHYSITLDGTVIEFDVTTDFVDTTLVQGTQSMTLDGTKSDGEGYVKVATLYPNLLASDKADYAAKTEYALLAQYDSADAARADGKETEYLAQKTAYEALGVNAEVWMAWKGDKLYFYIEVHDNKVVSLGAAFNEEIDNPYVNDQIELYYGIGGSFGIIRADALGYALHVDGNYKNEIEHATRLFGASGETVDKPSDSAAAQLIAGAAGYAIEIAIPARYAPSSDATPGNALGSGENVYVSLQIDSIDAAPAADVIAACVAAKNAGSFSQEAKTTMQWVAFGYQMTGMGSLAPYKTAVAALANA